MQFITKGGSNGQIKKAQDINDILIELEEGVIKLVCKTGRQLLDNLEKSSEDMSDVASGLEQLVTIIRTNPGGK